MAKFSPLFETSGFHYWSLATRREEVMRHVRTSLTRSFSTGCIERIVDAEKSASINTHRRSLINLLYAIYTIAYQEVMQPIRILTSCASYTIDIINN